MFRLRTSCSFVPVIVSAHLLSRLCAELVSVHLCSWICSWTLDCVIVKPAGTKSEQWLKQIIWQFFSHMIDCWFSLRNETWHLVISFLTSHMTKKSSRFSFILPSSLFSSLWLLQFLFMLHVFDGSSLSFSLLFPVFVLTVQECNQRSIISCCELIGCSLQEEAFNSGQSTWSERDHAACVSSASV